MIIAVTGMKRSASTWQFNVIRLYCHLSRGEKPIITGSPDQAVSHDEANHNQVVICKYHPYSKGLKKHADLIFTSSRNWDDALSSMSRFYGEPPSSEEIKKMKNWQELWKAVSDFHMKFTALKSDPDLIIRLIGLELFEEGIIKSPTKTLRMMVHDQLEKITPPPKSKEYDPETLLFWNHITRQENKR